MRQAGVKGLGVFALRDFSRGEVVLRFERGRVVHIAELAALSPWEREHLGELSAGTCQILPPPRCYLNHACTPNAISSSDAVHAWRAIRAGDEITIDYRLNALDDWELHCACGAGGGPHLMTGSFLTLPDALQWQYAPYAPPYVQIAFRRRHNISEDDPAHGVGEPLWPVRW